MMKVLAALLGASLVLSGCSDDGSSSPSSDSATTPGSDPLAPATTLALAFLDDLAPDTLAVAVGGHRVTVEEMKAQLATWTTVAEASGQTVREGDGYTSSFIGSIVEQYIRFQAFVDSLEAEGVTITARIGRRPRPT
ncbi:MAG: hypothetical protein R2695_01405 [Acidimicrobiales bacterium]